MSLSNPMPVWMRHRIRNALDQIRDCVYDWNIEHAQQHPSIDLRDVSSETGWAIACAKSVYVELVYGQDQPLRRRWSAWTRLHYRGHAINVTTTAFTGPAAVRKVRRQLVRQLRDLPLPSAHERGPED